MRLASSPARARRHGQRARRGFALLVAIYAATLMALAVVATELLLRSSTTAPIARAASAGARTAGINALTQLLDEWPRAYRTMAIGNALTYSSAGNGTVVVTRRDSSTYWFKVTGQANGATATRAVQGRRRRIAIPWIAPIVSVGYIAASGGTINASDTPPPNTTDCGPSTGAASTGMYIASSSGLQGSTTTVTPGGTTYAAVSSSLTPETLRPLGGTSPDSLMLLLNRVAYPAPSGFYSAATYDPNYAANVCDGFGSPLSPNSGCEYDYPVVYMQGGTLNGGSGQGLLLNWTGTLTITNAQYYGLIVSFGNVTIGSGASVYGQIVMLDPSSTLTISPGATIGYSSCAVSRVLLGRSLSRPVIDGTMADLLGTGW